MKDAVKTRFTNPNKILIPDGSITKKQIRDYLEAVSHWILPHIRNRPLALVRCPEGVGTSCFFQKRLLGRGNGNLKTQTMKGPNGKRTPLIAIDSIDGLTELAQMGTIEIHTWGTHLDHPEKPDLLVFDIDPDASIEWKEVAQSALGLREVLEKLGLISFLKVSGNKGLHLHVPILPTLEWNEAKDFAHAIARIVAEKNPGLYVTEMSKSKRKGKIFIDYLRNGFGATSIAPYSLRAKNGGSIALPIAWSEVEKVDPAGFHIEDVLQRLKKRKANGRGDPWRGYFSSKPRVPRWASADERSKKLSNRAFDAS